MEKQIDSKLSLLFILIAAFIFVSCSNSDDTEESPETDPEPAANQLSWDGQIYDLNDGLLTDFGESSNGYDVEIFLTDATLIFTNDEEYLADENGVNHLIGFRLSSSNLTELTIGEYAVSNNEELGSSTFTAEWFIDRTDNNNFEDSGDFSLSAVSGSMTISGMAPNLVISFDLKMGQKNLKGNFNRALKYYDQRD